MPSTLIEIPSDDVFRNDRLGLEPAIEVQSKALLSASPQAIAIDAGWGSGKTTFMRLWAAYLRKEGVKVVEFNAWKFSLSDPLDALTREILREFDTPEKEQAQPHRRLVEFVRYAELYVREGVKVASLLSPEIGQAIDGVEPAANAVMSFAKRILPWQSNSKPTLEIVPEIDSPDAFTRALSESARNWSEQHPVVIMVDELDRCSPKYAVEMLQLLEHIFYAENVVFVVSMNRAELVHSVRAFYGEGFDADGYLERFFDNVFGLPASNRAQYIRTRLEVVTKKDPEIELDRALPFFVASDLSLREIDRAIQQLEVVLESSDISDVASALVHLWVARTLAPVEYRQFISGGISDEFLAKAVFSNGDCAELRTETSNLDKRYVAAFEAILITTFCNRRLFSSSNGHPSARSKLYAFHRERVETIEGSGGKRSICSEEVINIVAYASSSLRLKEDAYGTAKVAKLLDRDGPLQ